MNFMKWLIVSAVLFFSANVWSQALTVPPVINYQGKLFDANADPLPTADYTLSFSIYDGPEPDANEIWGPQVFDGEVGVGHGARVPVVRGFFNVILGLHDTLNRPITNSFQQDNRYLEITIGDGPPIYPRQQMLSAPYALQAAGSVPIGGVIPYFGALETLPTNWMLCDGSLIVDQDSPMLGALTPDLRDRFIRGTSFATRLTGGSEFHTHYNDSNNITNWIPRKSLSGWISMNSPATSAGAFDTSRRNVAATASDVNNGIIPADSHGHTGGRVYGYSNSSLGLPPYMNAYYIIRIK